MESTVQQIILRDSELVNSTSSKKRQLILIQKNIFTVHSLDCCSQTSNSGASSHSPSSSKAAWSSCERKCETASLSCPELWNGIWMADVPWEMNNRRSLTKKKKNTQNNLKNQEVQLKAISINICKSNFQKQRLLLGFFPIARWWTIRPWHSVIFSFLGWEVVKFVSNDSTHYSLHVYVLCICIIYTYTV